MRVRTVCAKNPITVSDMCSNSNGRGFLSNNQMARTLNNAGSEFGTYFLLYTANLNHFA
jgi:hypothetical protein